MSKPILYLSISISLDKDIKKFRYGQEMKIKKIKKKLFFEATKCDPGRSWGHSSPYPPLSAAQFGSPFSAASERRSASQINYLPQALRLLADRPANNRIREDSARPPHMRTGQLSSWLPELLSVRRRLAAQLSSVFGRFAPFVRSYLKNLYASETRQKPIL